MKTYIRGHHAQGLALRSPHTEGVSAGLGEGVGVEEPQAGSTGMAFGGGTL